MFFDYSAGGHSRDYGWVKQGMIYPFVDYIDRFQGQSLYKIRPTRFRGGIEEPFLAERGFFGLQMDVGCSLQDSVSDQSVPHGIQEGVASNNVLECQSKAQVASDKSTWCCGSCGNRLPTKLSKKKSKGASSCFVGTLKSDIKCANILVHANGSVKLTDFGLAKEITKFNAVKSCKGTVYWMAPESFIIELNKSEIVSECQCIYSFTYGPGPRP